MEQAGESHENIRTLVDGYNSKYGTLQGSIEPSPYNPAGEIVQSLGRSMPGIGGGLLSNPNILPTVGGAIGGIGAGLAAAPTLNPLAIYGAGVAGAGVGGAAGRAAEQFLEGQPLNGPDIGVQGAQQAAWEAIGGPIAAVPIGAIKAGAKFAGKAALPHLGQALGVPAPITRMAMGRLGGKVAQEAEQEAAAQIAKDIDTGLLDKYGQKIVHPAPPPPAPPPVPYVRPSFGRRQFPRGSAAALGAPSDASAPVDNSQKYRQDAIKDRVVSGGSGDAERLQRYLALRQSGVNRAEAARQMGGS